VIAVGGLVVFGTVVDPAELRDEVVTELALEPHPPRPIIRPATARTSTEAGLVFPSILLTMVFPCFRPSSPALSGAVP
jgi:hypothetical protein